MYWIGIGLYLILVLLLLVHQAYSQYEFFQTGGQATDVCFKCMTFYSGAMSLKNPDDILSYLRGKDAYVQMTLEAFDKFMTESINDCAKNGSEATVTEIVQCFGNYMSNFMKKCQETSPFMECVLARNLADQVYRSALMCGTKACDVKSFKSQFDAAVKGLYKDFQDCKNAFQKADDPCVQMYMSILKTKQAPGAKAGITQNMEDGARTITAEELNTKMGDMATFAMNMT